MEDKFVCPECGGRLNITREHIYDKGQLLHPRTGKIEKRINRLYSGTCATLTFLHCVDCNFDYSEEDNGYPKFNEVIENSVNEPNCKIHDFDYDVFKVKAKSNRDLVL